MSAAGEEFSLIDDDTLGPAPIPHEFDNGVGLTDREAEVLRLVASAMSNEEISRALWISPNTVKTYIRSAYSRIGVQTRTQAVVWAYDHRLVAPRPLVCSG